MNHLNPHKTALAFGYVLGGYHLIWAILVALGLGQQLLNFVFWAHMLSVPVTVKAFDMGAAVTLVIMTGIGGYIVGWILATVWNKVH